MIKKLSALGNSAALVIDKPILELLKIDMETPLELSTDGKRLVITPVHSPVRTRQLLKAWSAKRTPRKKSV